MEDRRLAFVFSATAEEERGEREAQDTFCFREINDLRGMLPGFFLPSLEDTKQTLAENSHAGARECGSAPSEGQPTARGSHPPRLTHVLEQKPLLQPSRAKQTLLWLPSHGEQRVFGRHMSVLNKTELDHNNSYKVDKK